MADINKDRFSERLNAIQKKNDPKKKVVRKVNSDGLVVEVTKTRRKNLIPFKSLITIILILVLLKGFVYTQLGGEEYNRRIETLKQGQSIEVVAAFLLRADASTETVARGLSVVLPLN
ncbi:MAG: hypothetical protein ABJN34_09960 [Litoreibacter sp.]|uniref:hypothetical protein n=1 Tax=Litoreibacter sp. TaxID=1969459 RepID=UPI00329A24C6